MEELTADELAILTGGMEPETAEASTSLSMDEMQAINEADLAFTDEMTGDQKPAKFTGLSPDHAMGDTRILTSADRFALEFGNEEGSLNYLKNDPRFEDAAYNSAGTLTVKQGGKWYMADPNFDELESPWEMTRELVDDLTTDLTREVGVSGPATAAFFAGGPAASVAAAAGMEYLRTSMGRSLGTYSATPEQQTRDIAFEAALEAVPLVKHLPGVKPTAKVVVNGLKKTAARLKDPAQKGADVLWDFYGSLATSPEVTRTFRAAPEEVIGVMKRNGRAFQMPETFINSVVKEKIDVVARMASNAEKYLGKSYEKLKDNVVRNVPETFSGDARMYATGAYLQMVSDGAARITVKGRVPDERQMAGILQFMREKGRLPKGAQVSLRSQRELQAIANSGIQVPDALRRAAVDEDAYKALQQAHGVLKGFTSNDRVAAVRGARSAERLLNDKKSISKLLYGIADNKKLESMGDVSSYIHGMRKQMDAQTVDHFAKYDKQLAANFKKMNGTYSQYRDKLLPFINANRKAKTQGAEAYESLMNQLSQRAGKQVTKKEGMAELAELAGEMGDAASKKQFELYELGLRTRDAAIALNPLVTKRSSALGISAYAAFSVNAALGAAMATTAAMTNPRIQQQVLRTNHAMWQGLKQLKTMTKREIEFINRNPNAALTLVRAVQDGTNTYSSVRDAFDQQFPTVPMRGPSE